MKRFLLACAGLGVTLIAAAAPPPTIHNIAQDFVVFWDATQTIPRDMRVEEFKRRVGAQFPAFYGIERYGGKRTQGQQDMIIGRTFDKFGSERTAYLATVARFDAELPRHISTFAEAFPGFHPDVEIWFLDSLGEMDGGTRDFNGQRYLIFGADLMAKLHGGGDEAPFFHHELFHVYQDAVSPECEGQGTWQALWREGLAVYVSKQLNPGASEKEMLLDFPAGSLAVTKAHLYESYADIEKVLDDGDEKYYGPLFNTDKDSTGLAPRRGYYLGYLVAQEIGKTHDLRTMAALDCADARKLVVNAVQKLKRQAAPN